MNTPVCVLDVNFSHRWMNTRFPFKYGIASMTRLPHVFLQVSLGVGGGEFSGIASEGLAPKWFSKNEDTLFEEDLSEMLRVIERAVECVKLLGTKDSVFDLWFAMYKEMQEWAKENSIPPLLAHLGTSLVERAMIDAFCRSQKKSFGDLVRADEMGIELSRIHRELAGRLPSEGLPDKSLSEITVRHTIGLADPLTAADVEEAVDDHLPHSLEESIERYRLKFFKIKVCGKLEIDIPRLTRIAAILKANVIDFRITLDGNEQYRDIASFRSQWEAYFEIPELRELLGEEHLIFVEQPLHRSFALLDSVGDELGCWVNAPPIIIDESDAELSSFPRALGLGYRGTSHKNCKGVFKGIANRCLISFKNEQLIESDHLQMSGEDLSNVGPVSLLNDLAVMASLGIEHVERNGHHYFAGLSMYPENIQKNVLDSHGDLYGKATTSFPVVQINNGLISIDSINSAPFGSALIDWSDLGEPGLPAV